MEHKSLRQLRTSAEIHADIPSRQPLSRAERIERWAQAIECEGERHLNALFGTEYVAPDQLPGLRRDDSPLSVAFADPVLRAEGLRDDTYDAARGFFELSDTELHRVVCSCHRGERTPAPFIALQLRSLLPRPSLFAKVGRTVLHWFARR